MVFVLSDDDGEAEFSPSFLPRSYKWEKKGDYGPEEERKEMTFGSLYFSSLFFFPTFREKGESACCQRNVPRMSVTEKRGEIGAGQPDRTFSHGFALFFVLTDVQSA